MDAQSTTLNILDRFNKWIQESIMIKLFSIGFLIIILLIPSAWIKDLITERQQRADSTIEEIAGKWSGSQFITGPILVVPFKKQEVIDRGKEGKEIREYIQKAYFLPEQLDINGTIETQILHRGIFDAVVYETPLNIKSSFKAPDFVALGIATENVIWKDAHLVMGINDLRGVSENPVVRISGKQFESEPINQIGVVVTKKPEYTGEYPQPPPQVSGAGIITQLGLTREETFPRNVEIQVKLKGSSRLDFIPAGKTTTVKLTSSWSNPSFVGEFLPDQREINEGFSASWNVLHFNRPFSQHWIENDQQLSNANFGVKLLMPVDQYQKSFRTAKYGVLIILLTFMSLFLIELTQKVKIHPFQYILIGAALIIYYTLLLSLSEHVGYNLAYVISTIATVTLVALYSTTFLNTASMSARFTALLIVFYIFIYVIIQLQDYSLMLGSLGLFLIVGLLMYFSRKVKWYGETVKGAEAGY